jgi:hypothetical protein
MTGPGGRASGRPKALTVAAAVGLCAVCCPPLFLIPAAFVAGGTAGLGAAVSGQLGTAGSLAAAVMAAALLATGLATILSRRRRRREQAVAAVPFDLPFPDLHSQSRYAACEE